MVVNVSKVNCYVYHVFIHLETEENHIKRLENVFGALLKHGLRIELKKCSFIVSRLEFLAH